MRRKVCKGSTRWPPASPSAPAPSSSAGCVSFIFAYLGGLGGGLDGAFKHNGKTVKRLYLAKRVRESALGQVGAGDFWLRGSLQQLLPAAPSSGNSSNGSSFGVKDFNAELRTLISGIDSKNVSDAPAASLAVAQTDPADGGKAGAPKLPPTKRAAELDPPPFIPPASPAPAPSGADSGASPAPAPELLDSVDLSNETAVNEAAAKQALNKSGEALALITKDLSSAQTANVTAAAVNNSLPFAPNAPLL